MFDVDSSPGEGEGDLAKKQALEHPQNHNESINVLKTGQEEDDKVPKDNVPKVINLTEVYAAIRRITGAVTRTEEKVDNTNVELKKLSSQISNNVVEMKATRRLAESNKESIDDLYRLIEEMKMEDRKSGSKVQKEEIKQLRAEAEKRENYMRKVNLIFLGVPVTEGETNDTLAVYMQSYFKNILGITGISMDVAHRFGLSFKDQPKKVIVKFSSLYDRERVWRAKESLKTKKPPPPTSPIRVLMDKSKITRDRDTISYKILNKVPKLGYVRSASYKRGKLYIDGEEYTEDEYESLPFELRPSTLSTPRDNNTIAFFSHFSVLSSHYKVYFEVNGSEYNCLEQYLAYERASMVDDKKSQKKIMETSDPTEHKRFLTAMKNDGNDPEWKRRAQAVATQGQLAKFSQNHTLREFLLNTGDRRIGEASPDLFWGTGISLTDPRVLRCTAWKGENVMGVVLQEVRTILMRDN